MGLFDFLGLRRIPDAALDLYGAIVAHARTEGFYNGLGVPDTPAGRFDLISLHAYIVMRRLKELETRDGNELSQQLFDVMFADMDRSLREMGVGDLSVGKKVKAMARSYYGRIKAYDEGLAGEATGLEQALRRNLYSDADPDQAQVSRMAGYLKDAAARSQDWTVDQLRRGAADFSAPPEVPR
ncbi:MAG: hypothetical protein HQ503_03060 [Rhodospirillales bacterium]|nr:hypothetical protein [Rhodospirillales bacterium]